MWRTFPKQIYDILTYWNMKTYDLSCHFGVTVSDSIWNKCWIVSVDAVWLTSELLTNQWLPTILLLLSEPESIRMSVSEGAFTHLLWSHFLCLIHIQEGWRLNNKLKTWISLQLSSITFHAEFVFWPKQCFEKIHCMFMLSDIITNWGLTLFFYTEGC